MRRSYWLALAVAVAGTAWILSGQIAGSGTPPAETAPERAEERPPTAVRVSTRTAEPWQREIVLRGRTAASRSTVLRAETIGRVVELPVERGARVAEGDVIARLAMNDREARRAEARAQLEQRRIEHEAATRLAERGHRAETSVAAARAALDAARAALARIEVEIGYTVIRAPFDGVLDGRPVEIGHYLREGDEIATLVDLDPALVVGHLAEQDVARVVVGDTGRARPVNGSEVTGRVRYVASVAEPSTRTFEVQLEVPNPNGAMVDGVTTELRLSGETISVHRVSPAILTLDDAGRIGVKAIEDDSRVRFLPVRIAGDTTNAVLLAGLPETVTFVVVGQELVRDGQTVRPVPVDAPAIGDRR